MNKNSEIYVSTDIEADGPIPGSHSMLSFASAAYDGAAKLLDTFTINLEQLPGAAPHPVTMAWWRQFPEAWSACRMEPRPPRRAMLDYLAWLKSLSGRLVFVGAPASWDFMWIYWYLIRFTGQRPFREAALDIRSYAMGMRRSSFRRTSRTYLPKRWFDERSEHTHIPLDDALEQGRLFCNMLSENLSSDVP